MTTQRSHGGNTDLIQSIENEARRYAEMYQPGSDGRNTFLIFAEWIALQRECNKDNSPLVALLADVRAEIDLRKSPKLLARIEEALRAHSERAEDRS
jgi:hypothetical protein